MAPQHGKFFQLQLTPKETCPPKDSDFESPRHASLNPVIQIRGGLARQDTATILHLEDVFPLMGKTKVLRSRAKSQWIAVWWLLYQVQHPGRYLSRLQTDWVTHDIASVS